MRFYRYKGIRVIESNILLSHNKSARGAAIGYVILHKIPDSTLSRRMSADEWIQMDQICSDNGCKTLDAVLMHEREHILRQQEYGVLRWFWRYIWDKQFRLDEEQHAKDKEK